MPEFIDIDGPKVRAKTYTHESGPAMIVFQPFQPSPLSSDKINALIEVAKLKLESQSKILNVLLELDQILELQLLEQMGFVLDGIEYGLEIEKLNKMLIDDGKRLLRECFLRTMEFEKDIDAVVDLEKQVHAADSTSRVNFEAQEALESMKGYYRKISAAHDVYVLVREKNIVGVVGFMPDAKRKDAVHISSVSISLSLQGKGLLFPFVFSSFAQSRFSELKLLTGTTTTSRLIEAAKKYSFEVLGISLSRRE